MYASSEKFGETPEKAEHFLLDTYSKIHLELPPLNMKF
jgi:hypothetical protein